MSLASAWNGARARAALHGRHPSGANGTAAHADGANGLGGHVAGRSRAGSNASSQRSPHDGGGGYWSQDPNMATTLRSPDPSGASPPGGAPASNFDPSSGRSDETDMPQPLTASLELPEMPSSVVNPLAEHRRTGTGMGMLGRWLGNEGGGMSRLELRLKESGGRDTVGFLRQVRLPASYLVHLSLPDLPAGLVHLVSDLVPRALSCP